MTIIFVNCCVIASNTSKFENSDESLCQKCPYNCTHLCAKNVEVSLQLFPVGIQVVLGIFMIIMMIVSIAGNTIVCAIVYRKPAMRSAINLLLANMAFCDILLSFLCMPFAFVTLVLSKWSFGQELCTLLGCIHLLLVAEAVSILLTISVDRYLIIVKRKDKLTPIRAKIIIVISWSFSILISFPPLTGWGFYTYYDGFLQCVFIENRRSSDLSYVILAATHIFFIPIIIMFYSYASILNTVRKNSMRVSSYPPDDGIEDSQISKLGLTPVTRPPRVNVDMSFKTRAFKTLLTLYFVFVLCWLPYAISGIAWNVNKTTHTHPIAGTFMIWCGYLNCAINPIIYCLRIKKFREACNELLPKRFRITPPVSERTQRRVNPSSVYECREQSTV